LREAFQRMDANGDGLLDEGEHGPPPPPPSAN
jgi:Ca2+-binding EF-hand superfamily protein